MIEWMIFAFTRFSRASMQIPAEMFVGYLGTISCALGGRLLRCATSGDNLLHDAASQVVFRNGCIKPRQPLPVFTFRCGAEARDRGGNPENAAA